MRSRNIFVEIDGEIRVVNIDFKVDSDEIIVYCSSVFDSQVKTWSDYYNIYGKTYYKSLRGYRSGRKYKIDDLRK